MTAHMKWLLKAERHLNGAKTLFKDCYFDLCAYHTQQCVEKALKGYWGFQNHKVLKTEDLTKLLVSCINYEADFINLRTEVSNLNGFGTKFRYPDTIFEPPESATLQAISDAESVLNFVKNKII